VIFGIQLNFSKFGCTLWWEGTSDSGKYSKLRLWWVDIHTSDGDKRDVLGKKAFGIYQLA
jgi:hypothetical protein